MNKKIFSYMWFTSLFAAVLCIGPLITSAGDSVNKIKLGELNALLESNKGKVVIVDL